jgi:glycosyltransferase involved in cell wall biosynthesis
VALRTRERAHGGRTRDLLGARPAYCCAAPIRDAATSAADVVREHRVRDSRLLTVTNGVTRAFLASFAGEAGASPRLRPCVGYVGLMGYNHGIGIVLDVARTLPHMDFRLAGDGPERAAIEARIRDEAITNVRLEGYITDANTLEKLYRECDVLVNHTRGTPTLDRIVYPAKSFEYFATRRPVVYAGTGYAAELFREHDLCAVVPPDDAPALARGIADVLADPVTAAARVARARAFVEANACREDLMDGLANEITRRFGSAR